jgi:hypothetical protein
MVKGSQLLFAHLKPTKCFAGTYSTDATIANDYNKGCLLCDAGVLCTDEEIQADGEVPARRRMLADPNVNCPDGFYCNI